LGLEAIAIKGSQCLDFPIGDPTAKLLELWAGH